MVTKPQPPNLFEQLEDRLTRPFDKWAGKLRNQADARADVQEALNKAEQDERQRRKNLVWALAPINSLWSAQFHEAFEKSRRAADARLRGDVAAPGVGEEIAVLRHTIDQEVDILFDEELKHRPHPRRFMSDPEKTELAGRIAKLHEEWKAHRKDPNWMLRIVEIRDMGKKQSTDETIALLLKGEEQKIGDAFWRELRIRDDAAKAKGGKAAQVEASRQGDDKIER